MFCGPRLLTKDHCWPSKCQGDNSRANNFKIFYMDLYNMFSLLLYHFMTKISLALAQVCPTRDITELKYN